MLTILCGEQYTEVDQGRMRLNRGHRGLGRRRCKGRRKYRARSAMARACAGSRHVESPHSTLENRAALCLPALSTFAEGARLLSCAAVLRCTPMLFPRHVERASFWGTTIKSDIVRFRPAQSVPPAVQTVVEVVVCDTGRKAGGAAHVDVGAVCPKPWRGDVPRQCGAVSTILSCIRANLRLCCQQGAS